MTQVELIPTANGTHWLAYVPSLNRNAGENVPNCAFQRELRVGVAQLRAS